MTAEPTLLQSHLKELRRRVSVVCLAILAGSIVAYVFSEPISRFFMAPLFASRPEAVSLIYTNLTEAFIAYLKLSVLVGIIFSFPVLLYETWMFVAPGLTGREKRIMLLVIFWATLLFAGGAAFAYFVVLPKMLSFFLGFASENLEPLPKMGSYLTFVARTSLAFGLAFEIPFLMVAASKTGLVAPAYFREQRKYYYPGLLGLALLLCAGDLMATLLLAFPLAGLYEAGILVIRVFSSPA